MKNPDREAGVLAVLNELAQVSEAALLGLRVLFDDGDDRVSDRGFVFLKPVKNLVKEKSIAHRRTAWEVKIYSYFSELIVHLIFGIVILSFWSIGPFDQGLSS